MPDPDDREINQIKRAMRKDCAAARERIAPEARADAALRIAGHGIGFAGVGPGAIVSAYAAMGAEIDPARLIERLAGEGYRTCLPVVTPLGNPLTFRAWAPGQPLVAHTWGIREPADDAAEIEPDVLLIPLLAFDRRGVRLGYGGGYYDRTLETLRARKRVTAVGLAFAEQEVAQAPFGGHDQRLDWVLLPDGPLKTL